MTYICHYFVSIQVGGKLWQEPNWLIQLAATHKEKKCHPRLSPLRCANVHNGAKLHIIKAKSFQEAKVLVQPPSLLAGLVWPTEWPIHVFTLRFKFAMNSYIISMRINLLNWCNLVPISKKLSTWGGKNLLISSWFVTYREFSPYPNFTTGIFKNFPDI